jgi:cytochrome c
MSLRKRLSQSGAIAMGLVLACAISPARARDPSAEGPKLGRPASPEVVRQRDLTVAADGSGLPAGSGSVTEGRAIFAEKCVACHGSAGSGGVADRLTGGVGTLASPKPIRTVSSYWPYASTLFDYIRRAMPLTTPQSLDDKDVYGLVAYLLSVDGIVRADARLDADSLAKIAMPNRNGFVTLENDGFDGNIDRLTGRDTGDHR